MNKSPYIRARVVHQGVINGYGPPQIVVMKRDWTNTFFKRLWLLHGVVAAAILIGLWFLIKRWLTA